MRGAKGGYFLAQDPADVSVKDVVEAAEDHTFEVNCDVHQVDPGRCSPRTACSIRPVWRELQRRIDDLLAGVSLGDLLQQEAGVVELVGIEAKA